MIDSAGQHYIVQIEGTLIAESFECRIYLTNDDRVLRYDVHEATCEVLEDPETQLRDYLDGDEYAGALNALGLETVIDI